MHDSAFKHLTLNQLHDYLSLADTGHEARAIEKMSFDVKDELTALASYGGSKNGYEYQEHLDRITKGGYHPPLSKLDVRRGLEKLGIDDQIELGRRLNCVSEREDRRTVDRGTKIAEMS